MTAKLEKIYYENRSTPEIVKQGEPGDPKDGYGPETSRQDTTPAETREANAGRWVRSREDGKKPDDPKSKKSSYRPKLAATQLAAQKKRAEKDG